MRDILTTTDRPSLVAPLLEHALAYAARGWYVLPCRVGQRVDPNTGELKKDVHLPKRWNQISSIDPVQVRDWFGLGGEWEHGSVAIDTGRSGLVVADLDCSGGKNGLASWAEHGGPVASYVVATPSGGAHLYYAADAARPVGNDSTGKVGHGVDVRGVGGLVIAPPSADWRGSYRETPAANWQALTAAPSIVAERVPLGGQRAAPDARLPPQDVQRDPSGLATFTLPVGTPRYPVADANRRIMAVLKTVTQTPHGGGFNHALNEAAFELGHWVAGGHLSAGDAESLLAYAVTQVFTNGPDGDDLATIDSGLTSGQARPYATFTPAAQAVLDVGGAQPGPGFAKMRRGAITERVIPGPPSVYDPGCGPLFYSDGIHWIFGESGGGKTWVVMDAIARVLKDGGTALMVDYEDDVNKILDRLAALGVDDESVQGFAYVDGLNTDPQELVANLAHGEQFTLSVIDGVTSALNSFGASGRDESEVTAWADAVPRKMTGAVVVIDHVVKSADSRGGYAIGSQAKKSVVTGASYEVTCDAPLGKGRTGRVSLILRKDKRGGVPGSVGSVVARLEFASSADGLAMRTGVISARRDQEEAASYDPGVMLVASVLQSAHDRGDLNLEDGMRKLKEWVSSHGHLVDEGGTKRASAVEEAIRYARGWSGVPGVAERYRLRPMGVSDLPVSTRNVRLPDVSPGRVSDMSVMPSPENGGVSQDHGDVSHDHGDAGDATGKNGP